MGTGDAAYRRRRFGFSPSWTIGKPATDTPASARSISQAQYGEIHVWTSPLLTLMTGSGDCEHYAIAKFVALHQAGIQPEDLRIVIMHDTIRGEDHAVAAARLDGRWFTLDNRRMTMAEDAHIRNYGRTDQYGVMQYANAPLLAVAPNRKPSAAVKLAAEPGLNFNSKPFRSMIYSNYMGIRGTTPHVEISDAGTVKLSTLIEEAKSKITKGPPFAQQPEQKVVTSPMLGLAA